ncbi:hypothetical protein BCR33DRAFT_783381 [Rhizoclosmatium globosum]|uniref:Replication factor A C-terminal domain-containing protein n=1 Tax=Rhizoclosmatium globosum TaxID=329046 RepID=A0A1Y2CJA1_9FUNG|nr:hypothetical protein BCR33DRAFT_783381 [Rhizoclosmatium globosum]|eukprot:ORY46934.1 hypothetical protein BCR33DRAFT_783381 [Rhizoclosmatium globosum]
MPPSPPTGPSFIATIVQVRTRSIVSRVCPKCGAKLGRDSTVSVCGSAFFCDGFECKDRREAAGRFVVQLTLARGSHLIKAVAFDGSVVDLIGMGASEFDVLVNKHKHLPALLELHLLSLVCYVSLSGKEKAKTEAMRVSLEKEKAASKRKVEEEPGSLAIKATAEKKRRENSPPSI